jgi:hypothetical protein
MAHYAILNEDNMVATIVAADSIDGVEFVFPNYKTVCSTPENPATVGWIYDGDKFISPVVEEPTE